MTMVQPPLLMTAIHCIQHGFPDVSGPSGHGLSVSDHLVSMFDMLTHASNQNSKSIRQASDKIRQSQTLQTD